MATICEMKHGCAFCDAMTAMFRLFGLDTPDPKLPHYDRVVMSYKPAKRTRTLPKKSAK